MSTGNDTGREIRIGIVGAGGRGGSFKTACDDVAGLRIQAVCDNDRERLRQAAARLGAPEAFESYAAMLESSRLDAVIIGTPMPYHAPMAVAALQRGLSVLSEVPAAVSLEECRALAAAARNSAGVYMLAENYTYMKPNVMVREMARQGLFGAPYYAEGEYLHELKELNEITPWRRRWQTGVNGITYGTHSLGPILQWMPGERVVSVCCRGSGQRHRDPRGAPYENEATCVMLCKTRGGALIKIRVDMLSDRPHAMTNYQLQGTDGAYESARGGPGECDKVWLRALSTEVRWLDLNSLEQQFLPKAWRALAARAAETGHGGGDYFEILDFAEAVRGRRAPPISMHAALDMTLPGLVSQESIRRDGAWLPVPDSREW